MSFFNGLGSCLTLKALLEDPKVQNPQLLTKDLKKGDESPRFDASSAFLGPNLWDKTFGEEDLKFEYMDFEEFLTENGLHTNLEDQLTVKVNENTNNCNTEASTHSPVLSPNHHVSIPHSPTGPCSPQLTQLRQVPPNPYLLLSHSQHSQHSQQALSPMPSPTIPHPSPVQRLSSYSSSPSSSTPCSPESLASEVDFSESQGQENFNPQKRPFSEDELKPQPLIKKSKKPKWGIVSSNAVDNIHGADYRGPKDSQGYRTDTVYVPDNMKDDRYWSRREKNNYAAKRSRDARRVKENQIAMRAGYLEKENLSLKEELAKMKRENSCLRKSLSKYEPVAP